MITRRNLLAGLATLPILSRLSFASRPKPRLIRTGIAELDAVLGGGIGPGLCVISGRIKSGKTILINYIEYINKLDNIDVQTYDDFGTIGLQEMDFAIRIAKEKSETPIVAVGTCRYPIDRGIEYFKPYPALTGAATHIHLNIEGTIEVRVNRGKTVMNDPINWDRRVYGQILTFRRFYHAGSSKIALPDIV